MSIYTDVIKCYNTLVEMMEDRFIDTSQLKTATDFSNLESQLMSKTVLELPVNDVTKIVFFLQPKVKIADLKKMLQSNVHTHCIMVFREKPTIASIKAMGDRSDLRLEIFDIQELSFNISHHALVPKHVLIRDEEKVQSLLSHYKIKTKTQLPLILRTDPMARYLGLQPGDIIEITRSSPTAGIYKNYRCCV